jgi:hypothetical protein
MRGGSLYLFVLSGEGGFGSCVKDLHHGSSQAIFQQRDYGLLEWWVEESWRVG